MKHLTYLVAFATLGSILATSAVADQAKNQTDTNRILVNQSGNLGATSPYALLYEPATVVSFTGKVTGRLVAPPTANSAATVRLTMKTTNGGIAQVEVGPEWYVDRIQTGFRLGDTLQVTGSRVQLSGGPVIMARDITNQAGKLFVFRDRQGSPIWAAVRDGMTLGATPEGALSGQILESRSFEIGGVPQLGFVVNTPGGPVNVIAGPQWFMDRQDFMIRPGAYVTVVGQGRPTVMGPNTIFANGIYGSGSALVFNPSLVQYLHRF